MYIHVYICVYIPTIIRLRIHTTKIDDTNVLVSGLGISNMELGAQPQINTVSLNNPVSMLSATTIVQINHLSNRDVSPFRID